MIFTASDAFGLEGVTAGELRRMGMEKVMPLPTGGVQFEGDLSDALRANLWLRSADRVLLEMGRFTADSFDALFEGVRALEWSSILPRNARFPVRAHCARSRLMSPSDCQSIVKKAVADVLGDAYRQSWLSEDGATFQIDVSIRNDLAVISLDTSGAALNRRGYRTWTGEAPLRETLAASLALLAWKPNEPLYDPCCGTGTILVEAAMIAQDRAPGLLRGFDLEDWPSIPRNHLREEAVERWEAGRRMQMHIAGSDIDPDAIELAKRHLHQAKIEGVRVETRDLRSVKCDGERGVFLCNPPYGDRMGDRASARAVEKALYEMAQSQTGWQLCAFSADPLFEKNVGRRADRRRRLYNGRLECELLTFFSRP